MIITTTATNNNLLEFNNNATAQIQLESKPRACFATNIGIATNSTDNKNCTNIDNSNMSNNLCVSTKQIATPNAPIIISGIDSLYYFIESNTEYDNLYLEIVDMVESAKDRYERNDLPYLNEEVKITLNGREFFFMGKTKGFYWLRDCDKFFRIGFKDNQTNKNLHDIQVQLEASGIYTIGIKTTIELIDDMLDGYITDIKQITRADLNAFVSYDFSFLTKSSFVSKKQSFSEKESIYECGIARTFYIGKKPCKLRVYNKKAELLSKGNKTELMEEFFANYGLSINGAKPIWNIEFELHREFLKQYDIKTLDDLLSNAKTLFQACMDMVRVIDEDTLTPEIIASGHSSRAINLPIWDEIKESYKLDEFLSLNMPINRIKRNSYKYGIDEALQEHFELGRKARLHGLVLESDFYSKVSYRVKKSFDYKDRLLEEVKLLATQNPSFNNKDNDSSFSSLDTNQEYSFKINPKSKLPILKEISLAVINNIELFNRYEYLVNIYFKGSNSKSSEKAVFDALSLVRDELILRVLLDINSPP